MDYPAYPVYRESGIEWLGKIPDHWQILPIKRFTLIKRGASPRPIDDEKYFDDDGEYAWVRIADVTANKHYLKETTQRLSDLGKSYSVPLESGQLFLSIAGSVGKPMISKIKCCIHDGFVYFQGLTQEPEFLYYIFESAQPYLGLGKLGTQLNLNTDTVGGINIGLPPIDEQQTIAQFLDHKTQQIDQLIAKKQTLIDKLNEQRIALITHAVTKGLNPAVTLEDSGVEWLGKVPKHWDIRRLKFVMESFGGGTPNTSNDLYWNGDIPWVSPKDMKTKIITKTQDNITQLGLEQSSSKIIKENAVLMVVRSGILRHSIPVAINIVPVSINQDMKALIPDDTVLMPQYLQFFIDGNQKDLLDKWSKQGCTVESIESDYMLNSMMVLPPLEEQTQIVDHLDRETERVDRMVVLNQQTIDKLKEYRTALITAAVTGKIDLRKWQQEANHAV